MTGLVVLAALLGGVAAWGWLPAVSRTTGPGRSARESPTREARSAGARSGRRRSIGAWLPGRAAGGGGLPVLELLSALSAELETGQPTNLALLQAVRDLHPDPCPRAGLAASSGGDVAMALRLDADRAGASALRSLAACWEVAEHSGAGLALAVSRLAEGVRAAQQSRAQLDAEVAAVRTSARMLAALPLFGLLIGHWIGAEPVAWLLGSWIGRLVLVAGVGLQLLGLAWLRRMVAGVEVLL